MTLQWLRALIVCGLACSARTGASSSARSTSTSPHDYVERFLAATEHSEKGELAAARADFEAALALRPGSPTCAYALACVASREGALDRAARELSTAIDFGFADTALAEWDSDLARLRASPRWMDLLERMRAGNAAQGPVVAVHPFALLTCGSPSFTPDGARFVAKCYAPDPPVLVDARTNEIVKVLVSGFEPVDACVLSPDGRLAATGAQDGPITIVDVASGRAKCALSSRATWTWDENARFSADGSRLLVVEQNARASAALYDTADGHLVQMFSFVDAQAFALSPDGTKVVCAGMRIGEMGVFLAAVGERESHLLTQLHDSSGVSCGFTGDGHTIWLRSQGLVQVFDAESRARKGVLSSQHGLFTAACAVGDRALVTVDDHGVLTSWDIPSLRATTKVDCGTSGYVELRLSPDRRLILAWSERYLTPPQDHAWIWSRAHWMGSFDAETLARAWTFEGTAPRSIVGGARFRPRPREIWLPSENGWDVLDADRGERVRRVRLGARTISKPAFDLTGSRLAVPCDGGELALVDLSRASVERTLSTDSVQLSGARWTADGNITTSDGDGRLRLWNPSTGSVACSRDAAVPGCWRGWRAEPSPDGSRIVTFGGGSPALVWNARSGELVARIAEIDEGIVDADWSADGSMLATASWSTNRVALWSGKDGARLGEPIAHSNHVECVTFDHAAKRLATGCDDSNARVYDVSTRKLLRAFEHEDLIDELSVDTVRFSPDDKSLLTTTHEHWTVRLFDLVEARRRWNVENGGGGYGFDARFDPSGKRILADGGFVGVRSATSGEALFEPAPRTTRSLAVGPDGRFMIAVSESAVSVLDADAIAPRYELQFPVAGGWLANDPSGACFGAREAIASAFVRLHGGSTSLASIAGVVLDRKRVRASAAGVRASPIAVPDAPIIESDKQDGAVIEVPSEGAMLGVRGVDPLGVHAIEVEENRVLVDPAAVETRTSFSGDRTHVELHWPCVRPSADAGVRLTVRIVGRHGVTSADRRFTLVRAKDGESR